MNEEYAIVDPWEGDIYGMATFEEYPNKFDELVDKDLIICQSIELGEGKDKRAGWKIINKEMSSRDFVLAIKHRNEKRHIDSFIYRCKKGKIDLEKEMFNSDIVG